MALHVTEIGLIHNFSELRKLMELVEVWIFITTKKTQMAGP